MGAARNPRGRRWTSAQAECHQGHCLSWCAHCRSKQASINSTIALHLMRTVVLRPRSSSQEAVAGDLQTLPDAVMHPAAEAAYIVCQPCTTHNACGWGSGYSLDVFQLLLADEVRPLASTGMRKLHGLSNSQHRQVAVVLQARQIQQ